MYNMQKNALQLQAKCILRIPYTSHIYLKHALQLSYLAYGHGLGSLNDMKVRLVI
jgi:hypothetical protein